MSRYGNELSKRSLLASEALTQDWQDRLQAHAIAAVRGLVYADKAGTLYLEESDDAGATDTDTATVAVSANTLTELPWTALTKRWYRFRYANGAAAQTSFKLVQDAIGLEEANLLKLTNLDLGIAALRDALRGTGNKTIADVVAGLGNKTLADVVAAIQAELTVKLSGSNLQESYIIPMFDLLAWSGFTNQPAGDGVEVVSNNAGDTGKCTIFGTKNSDGSFQYETITLNGVTAVATTKTDWGNVYGVFLGDIYGQNISPAVGTITVREASADQTITTLAANAISKGMVAFNLTGKNIILNVHSGNVWKRCAGPVTTANGLKMNLTGGNIKEEKIASMLYLISDTTGATAQIEVLA